MQKQIIVSVIPKGDGDFGPNFALIMVSGDACSLREKMDVTKDLALSSIGGWDDKRPGSGSLFATEWWLRHLPLNVTWLRHASVVTEENEDENWVQTLQDDGWVSVEGFEPVFGGPKSLSTSFVAVDAETVKIFPTGNMTVEAVVDGTSKEFFTEEFPMTALMGLLAD